MVFSPPNPVRLTLPAVARLRPRAFYEQPYELTDEERDSLVQTAVRSGLGALGFVGNVLDTPASIVRNTLAARNPLQGLFAPEKRTTGRELLQGWGMVGLNRPGFDWEDVGSFVTEMALDPLMFLGGGLSKAGRVVEKAGLLDEATDIARAASLGKRVGQMRGSVRQVIEAAPEAERAARQASLATAAGGAEKLESLMDTPLRGLANVGPLGLPRWGTIGTGPGAQRVARGMDWLGEAVRWSPPVRLAAAVMHAPSMGAVSREGQEAGARLFKQRIRNEIAARQAAEDIVALRTKHGLFAQTERGNQAIEDLLYQLYEAPNHEALLSAANQIHRRFGVPIQELRSLRVKNRRPLHTAIQNEQSWGIPTHWLQDPTAKYFPHRLTMRETPTSGPLDITDFSDISRLSPQGSRILGVRGGEQMTRMPIFSEIVGGARTIRSMSRQIKRELEKGSTVQEVANFIRRKWGDQGINRIPATFLDAAGETKNRYVALANEFAALHGVGRGILESGTFGAGTVYAMIRRLEHGKDAVSHAQSVARLLSQPNVLKPATQAAYHPETKRLVDVLSDIGLEAGDANKGFLRQLAQTNNMEVTEESLKALQNMHVDRKAAEEMSRITKAFRAPHELGPILNHVHSLTNLWKGLLTSPWPAFGIRNRISGAIRNWQANMFSFWSERAAHNLVTGGTLEAKAAAKLAKVPAFQHELQRLGLDAANPEHVTQVASRLAFRYGLIGRFQGEVAQRSGPMGELLSTAFADTARGFPGGLPGFPNAVSGGRIARKYAFLEPETTWKPWHQRGTFGHAETRFGPGAGGEELNQWIESLNRLAPWFDEMAKGSDPLYAKLKVGTAQVEYASRYYTPTERQWMTVLFPFWKFSSRNLPYVVRELLERPGGKTGQMIRGASRLRDPSSALPEYVAESTAIPVPGGPGGHERYITGFGFMHEDPLRFFSPSLRKTGMEFVSRMNPAIKGPLEGVLGQSFFMKGRKLEDVDPILGRIVSNVAGITKPASAAAGQPPAWTMRGPGYWPEVILGNSPISRALTSMRTLTDPRKRISENVPLPGWPVGMNMLTGIRVSDVSEGAKDAILRESLKDIMKGMPGAKVFEKVYFKKAELKKLPEKEQVAARRLQAVMDMLAERAKQRVARKAVE